MNLSQDFNTSVLRFHSVASYFGPTSWDDTKLYIGVIFFNKYFIQQFLLTNSKESLLVYTDKSKYKGVCSLVRGE